MPMVHDATTWPCAGWARTAACAISPTATSRNRVTAANVLASLGVAKGGRVHPGRAYSRPLHRSLGTLKHVSVFCPLFAAFGPEPIYQRLSRGDATVLVTTERLYRQKVAGLRSRLPHLQCCWRMSIQTWTQGLVAPHTAGCSLQHVCDPTHRSGGHGGVAFHQRDHWYAQGSRACTQRGADALYDGQIRAGLPPGRCLLVHC